MPFNHNAINHLSYVSYVEMHISVTCNDSNVEILPFKSDVSQRESCFN